MAIIHVISKHMRVRRNRMNIKKSINIYSFKYIILSYSSFMYKDDIDLGLEGCGDLY